MTAKAGRAITTGCLILALAALAAACAREKWQGTSVKEGDVTIVRNPKRPLFDSPVLELEEDLSIGGPQAEGESVFGRILGFVVDDNGAIYVLDQKDSHIRAFDASGRYLRTIGRKGQGPGELFMPMTLSLNRAAGELAVLQLSRRISYFKTDGTFLRQQPLKDTMALRGQVDSRGNIYVIDLVHGDRDSSYTVKKLSAEASMISIMAQAPAPGTDRPNPFMAIPSFQIDRNDDLVYGCPETYEVQFLSASDGKVFKKIRREYDPMPVTEAEKKDRLAAVPPGSGITYDFSKFHSAYEGFFVSDLGHLFVRTWEKTDDGKAINDVFDPEGRFLGRIPLKSYGIAILKGEYYALEQDEEGYQYVKRYAVAWRVRS
jgi:hypothetical protein